MIKENINSSRIIFINNSLGRRQLRETLGNLLVSLVVTPQNIWLVSPWVSDFELLDNRSGDWNAVEPGWGMRKINFSEILISAIESGCRLRLVTTDVTSNQAFIQRLQIAVPDTEMFQHIVSEDLHIKGLLTNSFFLAGSMNFTYSGTHFKEEQVQLSVDAGTISEAKLEFQQQYGQF